MSGNPLALIDWIVIGVYLAVALGAGMLLARRSRGSVENFFLSGRRLPWWLAGTSMVATSFATDTPLVVCGWTRTGGVAANWRWWAYAVSGVLVAVFFSRFWRRSGVVTDVELMELRYSGAPARFLRGFKSIYQVIFMHCFVLGWVILGMTKVLVVLFGLGDEPLFTVLGVGLSPAWVIMLGCALLALVYSEIAGLWGVVLTDFVQFGFALMGAVVLMFVVGDAFGGMGALVDALQASDAVRPKLSTAPATEGVSLLAIGTWTAEVWRFAVFVGVIWFASKNADGSGIMVQRLLASKNERHAVGAGLWYAVAHYAIRPWPWIVVALASLLVLPTVSVATPVDGTVVAVGAGSVGVMAADGTRTDVAVPVSGVEGWEARAVVDAGDTVLAGQTLASTDDEAAYPFMMRRYLPAGLLGLMVASFLAAFMSTVDTHVNLASAYLVNDVYDRFLNRNTDAASAVRMARIFGPLVLALAMVFALNADSVRGMFDTFTTLFGGMGIVYVLRWTWWRVNAWSEIAALGTGAAVTWSLEAWPAWGVACLPEPLVQDGAPVFAGTMLLVVGISLAVTLPVTLLTPPVDPERLADFYRRVRPMGAWGPYRDPDGERGLIRGLGVGLAWMGALAVVFASLFLPGDLLLNEGQHAASWGVVGVVGLVCLGLGFRFGAEDEVEDEVQPGS